MKNILVIYNANSNFTATVAEYVDAFRKFSRNNVHYLHVGHENIADFDLNRYDAILITYSYRMCYLDLYTQDIRKKVSDYRGLKMVFIQDEHQQTNRLRAGMDELGIDVAFTCVPEDMVEWAYPQSAFTKPIAFYRVITGYVSRQMEAMKSLDLPSLADRPNVIGYRGRNLWHRFGDLGFNKIEIGRRFRAACQASNIPCDIAWTEEERIYADAWYDFLSSCRATLATPSGSNVFDFDGEIEVDYHKAIAETPDLSYEDYRPRIAHKELEIDMGQVSPRIFEAAAFRCAMITLEGRYSSVLTPGVDCIVINKDYSNMNEVLDQVQDVRRLVEITENAYNNVIASRLWSYQAFIDFVDDKIEKHSKQETRSFSVLKGYDQDLLETMALRDRRHYPTTNWLDLSHLRRPEPEAVCLAELVGEIFAPPPPPPPEPVVVYVQAEPSVPTREPEPAAMDEPVAMDELVAAPPPGGGLGAVKRLVPLPVKQWIKDRLLG
jgi:hypothetical protein